jgi:hypothetical protein
MTKVMTEIIEGETYQYYPLGKHVVRAVGVCGGRPTFKYTWLFRSLSSACVHAAFSFIPCESAFNSRVSQSTKRQ